MFGGVGFSVQFSLQQHTPLQISQTVCIQQSFNNNLEMDLFCFTSICEFVELFNKIF